MAKALVNRASAAYGGVRPLHTNTYCVKDMDRDEFEIQCQELVGNVVIQVLYYEIEYQNGEQFWNRDPRFDSLDYGLDLVTKDGKIFSVIWDNKFFPYGISIKNDSLENFLRSANIIVVSNSSRWQDVLGQEIVMTSVIWSWVNERNSEEKIYYPQDLVIRFESGQEIFLSALEISDDNSYSHMADNITVIFDKSVATAFQVAIAG